LIPANREPAAASREVSLRALAWTFFLLGLTSYGGPAIVAQVRKAIRRQPWLSDGEIQESLAFCQVLLGPGRTFAVHLQLAHAEPDAAREARIVQVLTPDTPR
jgi:chromate transport protein ChrA